MTLLPGFADPVADSQASFRAVLDAMAHPGRVVDLGRRLTPPAPLEQAAAALLLTLVDADSPVWLDPAFETARGWIGFHCGAVPLAAPAGATFGVALGLPDLAAFGEGSDECPEDSATLIAQLPGLRGGRPLRLAGPGLRAPAEIAPGGLPADFAARWAANAARYPRGIDLLLCAGPSMLALPRSVAVTDA